MTDHADQPFQQAFPTATSVLLLIARAMVKHPHYLDLDEPCLGLDGHEPQLVLLWSEKYVKGQKNNGSLRQPPRRRQNQKERELLGVEKRIMVNDFHTHETNQK